MTFLFNMLAARAGDLEPIARVATAAGARTGLFVPALDCLPVAIAAGAQQQAIIRVFKPEP